MITTVKRIIKPRHISPSEELKTVVEEIWNIFNTKQHYSQEFLYTLFGVKKVGKGIDVDSMKKYGLMETFEKHGEEEIGKGQKYLRERIAEVFKQT